MLAEAILEGMAEHAAGRARGCSMPRAADEDAAGDSLVLDVDGELLELDGELLGLLDPVPRGEDVYDGLGQQWLGSSAESPPDASEDELSSGGADEEMFDAAEDTGPAARDSMTDKVRKRLCVCAYM